MVGGEEFARLDRSCGEGVAAMVRAGAPVIVDDVLLSGDRGQERWRTVLAGINSLWMGVHFDAALLTRRERAHGNRTVAMAAGQAPLVHAGVSHDLELDTTRMSSEARAERVAARP